MYIADAEQAGHSEVVQFFREVQEEERRRSDRAKQLLSRRLGD
jgi:rubrerythrin